MSTARSSRGRQRRVEAPRRRRWTITDSKPAIALVEDLGDPGFQASPQPPAGRGYARFVGRIGALAVALGATAAIMVPGVAAASPGAAGSGASGSGGSTGSVSPSQGSAG